jgi:DNA-binding MarR family transcriptional regulator/GNAT superfamily N-acetyltransferase
MPIQEQVETVRRFNRVYTQRIGALEGSFLGMGLPLSAMRLLFEIGSAPGTVRALRARLGLDSGYLSRLLRQLEAEGLVEVVRDPADGRRRLATLTARGRRRWDVLDARSQRRALELIEPLPEAKRARLAAALCEADLLVRAATVTIEDAHPASELAQEAVGLYFAELGQRFGFVGSALDANDVRSLSQPSGVFVVAVSDGEAVACGGVHTIEPTVGEIKRMWVHASWRGAGLGSRLLGHLEARARGLGHIAVRLDTNQALTEAIAMYERAGYRPVHRYNDNPYATHFFEKSLT